MEYVPSAPETSNFPLPDGKIADEHASTHDCTTAADAPVNYRMYVQQRTLKTSHRLDGKIADALASTLAYTTVANAPVNYSLMYVHQSLTQNFPSPRRDFHMVCACACRAVVCSSSVAR